MKTTPRSRLLLIELVCDFIIFALCAAVCVTLLVRARTMSRESTLLTQAVYIAQDAAERYRSGQPLYDFYLADGTPDTSTLDLASRPTQPAYYVAVQATDGGAEITVYPVLKSSALDAPFYSLSVGKGALS